MSPRTLEGEVAVVTGAGRGIGAAVARKLAREGAKVALVARTKEEIEAVAAEITAAGGTAAAIVTDASDESAVEKLPAAVEKALGTPATILVHAAGASASSPFAKIALEDWRAMMDANATSAFLCARAFAPILTVRGAGRIVFIASIAGLGGARYLAHYTAAKHAVVGLMRALAAELEPTGVTVNAICPGYVDTPMTQQTLENVERRTKLDRDAALAAVLGSADQARLVSPEEVAAEVAALCHPEAVAVNGQTIVLHPRTATS